MVLDENTYLRDNVQVAQAGHVGMVVSVDGDVVTSIESLQEKIRMLQDVEPDHEVGGLNIIGGQEIHER